MLPPSRGINRRRKPGYEPQEYRDGSRYKSRRSEYEREGSGYYNRDRGRQDRYSGGRPQRSRYGGVRRETFLNGSYNDYIREFSRTPSMPMPGYGPPPPTYGQPPPYPYERPRDYPPPMDYPPQQHSRSSRRDESKKGNSSHYERDVENFLRNTARASRERRNERHHYRERERERDRDRDRR